MADHLPRPVLAALGALDQVRRLPSVAMQLPLVALTALDRARHSYDLLALRGQEVVQHRFGEQDGEVAEPVVPVVPVLEEETVVVLDAVAHVEDPLDAPHVPAGPAPGPEPIPGYDEMTLGALRGHLRTLTVADLERVVAYEKTHQARAPMLTLVEHRLAKLALE